MTKTTAQKNQESQSTIESLSLQIEHTKMFGDTDGVKLADLEARLYDLIGTENHLDPNVVELKPLLADRFFECDACDMYGVQKCPAHAERDDNGVNQTVTPNLEKSSQTPTTPGYLRVDARGEELCYTISGHPKGCSWTLTLEALLQNSQAVCTKHGLDHANNITLPRYHQYQYPLTPLVYLGDAIGYASQADSTFDLYAPTLADYAAQTGPEMVTYDNFPIPLTTVNGVVVAFLFDRNVGNAPGQWWNLENNGSLFSDNRQFVFVPVHTMVSGLMEPRHIESFIATSPKWNGCNARVANLRKG